MSSTQESPTSTKPTRLLVSIRDRQEAELVLQQGVDWIDLKEPKSGALGRPSLSLATSVHSVLSNHQSRSVALGELRQLMDSQAAYEEAIQVAELFPVAKVGMSNVVHENWQSALRKLQADIGCRNCQLVPVMYADGAENAAPNWTSLVQFLDAQQAKDRSLDHRILIDTFAKDGRNLLDRLPIDSLRACMDDCRRRSTSLVLAGSLRAEHIQQLLNLGAEAIGVRGAVCEPLEVSPEKCNSAEDSGTFEEQTRAGKLSSEKLASIVRLFSAPQRAEMRVANMPTQC